MLIKPVTTQGETTLGVYLPGKEEVRCCLKLLFRLNEYLD